jgi:Lrp/AsnC family leucine-responsive transcriptional regulator
MSLDTIDLKALAILQREGRESWAALGGSLGMTGPAAADRVRRLESAGVITGYRAIIEPRAIGLGLTAFIAVSLGGTTDRAAFLARIARMPEILECHHVSGDDDYLLKVRCAGTPELDRLLVQELKGMGGVVRTRTTVVLGTAKETGALPLPTPAKAPRRLRRRR